MSVISQMLRKPKLKETITLFTPITFIMDLNNIMMFDPMEH